MIQRLLRIAKLGARPEHGGVVVVSTGRPESRAHLNMQCQRALEMLNGLRPAAQSAGQQAQVARDRAEADGSHGRNRVAQGIGQEELI